MAKKLTANQVRVIYNSGLHAYNNSFAMMSEDIMAGMKPAAAKYGKTPCYDIPWFQTMAGYIRTCRPWAMIPEEKRREIVDMVNDSHF
jgi:hypothetical protein